MLYFHSWFLLYSYSWSLLCSSWPLLCTFLRDYHWANYTLLHVRRGHHNNDSSSSSIARRLAGRLAGCLALTGWNATTETTPVWPRKLCVQYPLSTSHTLAVESLLPVATRVPVLRWEQNCTYAQGHAQIRQAEGFHMVLCNADAQKKKAQGLLACYTRGNAVAKTKGNVPNSRVAVSTTSLCLNRPLSTTENYYQT